MHKPLLNTINQVTLPTLLLPIFIAANKAYGENPTAAADRGPQKDAEAPINHRPTSSNYCGINALYITLKTLGNDNPDYLKLINTFPNVEANGITIEQLEKFLSQSGYACEVTKTSYRTLSTLPPSVIAIVLQERDTNYHLYLAKPTGSPDEIQIIDPPFKPTIIKTKDQNSPVFCMCVSKHREDLPYKTGHTTTATVCTLAAALIFTYAATASLKSPKSKRV